jgi:hypothetical protein
MRIKKRLSLPNHRRSICMYLRLIILFYGWYQQFAGLKSVINWPIKNYQQKTKRAGHSSIIDETKQQLNGLVPDCVIISVGGGGLACGIVEGLVKHNWLTDNLKVILVETEGADCFNKSVKANQLVTLDSITRFNEKGACSFCAFLTPVNNSLLF